jgi:hypothetical protein
LLFSFLAVSVVGGTLTVAFLFGPDLRLSAEQANGLVGPDEGVRKNNEAWVAASQRARSGISFAPANPVGARPNPVSSQWAEGIHGKAEFSFPSSYGFEFRNVWWHDAGDVYLTVLAGSVIRSGRPIVQIMETNPLTLRTRLLHPLSPNLTGPVRIIDAQGMTLILESVTTGERASLEVSSRTSGSA